eukprot:726949-Prorocentrum_minimum.AAC.4
MKATELRSWQVGWESGRFELFSCQLSTITRIGTTNTGIIRGIIRGILEETWHRQPMRTQRTQRPKKGSDLGFRFGVLGFHPNQKPETRNLLLPRGIATTTTKPKPIVYEDAIVQAQCRIRNCKYLSGPFQAHTGSGYCR